MLQGSPDLGTREGVILPPQRLERLVVQPFGSLCTDLGPDNVDTFTLGEEEVLLDGEDVAIDPVEVAPELPSLSGSMAIPPAGSMAGAASINSSSTAFEASPRRAAKEDYSCLD